MSGLLAQVRKLDAWLRFADIDLNRTTGGLLGAWTTRHTISAVVLPAAMVFFLVNGPSMRLSWRLLAAVVVALASAPIFGLGLRLTKARSIHLDLLVQGALLLAIAGVVWMIGGDREATPAAAGAVAYPVYQHALVPAAALVVIAALLGTWLARHLFTSDRGRTHLPPRLRSVELFASLPRQQPATVGMLALAAFGAVTASPARVLFPPAFVVLFVEPAVNGGAARAAKLN